MICKNRVLILVILFFSVVGYSQESKWSVSTNYPISIGSPDFRNVFGGVNNFGIKYRYWKFSKTSIGFMLNFDSYESRSSIESRGNAQFSFLKPGVFLELFSTAKALVRPYFGITHSYVAVKFMDGNNDTSRHGINSLIGVNCKVYGGIFINLQYDHTRIISNRNTFITSLEKEFNVLKVGVEYIF